MSDPYEVLCQWCGHEIEYPYSRSDDIQYCDVCHRRSIFASAHSFVIRPRSAQVIFPQIDVFEDSQGYWCRHKGHVVRGRSSREMDSNLNEFITGWRDLHYRGFKEVVDE
jgi:hypothetical protein